MIPLSLYAQTDSPKDSVGLETASVKQDTTMVQSVNVQKLQAEIENLTNQVRKLSETEKKLKAKECEIKRLKEKLIFADSIVARLSNDCLRKKYNQVNVSNAIKNFDKMYSPELKSKFARLKTLLNDYSQYTDEITKILIEAQNDKSLGNPFTGQKKAFDYINKLKNTNYYREVYNANWTIPYLNTLIDKSIKILKAFNPKETKEMHLLELF